MALKTPTKATPVARPPWHQRWILPAVCAVVIAVYACVARSGPLELPSLNPAGTCYNLLVQGFQAGQLSLKKPVPPGLAQLADPYDPNANAPYWRGGKDLLGDLSYYKGRLYLYFGVTPALLLFWPFAALTGHYLYHGQAAVSFCALGFLASVGLLLALWRRYFSGVSAWVVAAGALAIGLASGIPPMLPRGSVYEAAIGCGYAMTMLALGAIWKALHEPEPRHRLAWLATASAVYGLAVAARPSLLFGAVILLVPVARAWRERGDVAAAESRTAGIPPEAGKRRPVAGRGPPMAAAAIGPIALIGLGLMLYNWLRFDNPFQFGLRYQLGSERQLGRQFFGLQYLWFNLRVYFLEPARWSARFPFAHDAALPSLPPGYGSVWQAFALINIPLVFLALAVPLARRGRSAEAWSSLGGFLVAVVLLFGTQVLTLGLYCFSAGRFEVEFLPELVLLAVIGIMSLERALARRSAPIRALRWGWSLLLGFSVAFNLFVTVAHYADAENRLGLALMLDGRLPPAIRHFDQALKIDPDLGEASVNLGVALLESGHADTAVTILQRRLSADPDDAAAHSKLGMVLIATGRPQEAIGHLERALQIRPDLSEAQNNLAWVLAILPPAQGGNPIRAVSLAQQACERTGYRAAGDLDTLAVAYAAAGRFSEAIATAQKAIDLARAAGQPRVAADIESRLKLYRGGRPYREPGAKSP